MNKGMPMIWENPEELRKMIRKETAGWRRTKLEAIYMIATRRAKNRSEVAARLGINREIVGDWIFKYECGGLERVLEVKPKGGSKSSLPKEVIEAMREKLQQPEGVKSYKDLLAWVKTSFSIITSYFIVYYTATKILGARLAVGRKSHIQKKKVGKKPSNRASNKEFDMQP